MLRMCLEMAEDRDVTGVADLFRQIGGVVDEFGPEIGVFLLLRQKPKIDRYTGFAQCIVDKPCMARLVPCHQLEQLGDILVVPAAFHFLVQHTARKLGRAGADQKVDEFLLQLRVPSRPNRHGPSLRSS